MGPELREGRVSRGSKIPWTGPTWNFIRGCDPVSPGCKHCYAVRMAHRFPWGKGLTVIRSQRPSWSGKIQLVPEKLVEPLTWKRPQRIFPCSGADLFHEDVPFEYIAAAFGVMAAARHHVFQVLTKRPERIPLFFEWLLSADKGYVWQSLYAYARDHVPARRLDEHMGSPWPWPLPNVWLGTSVESPDYLWRVAELFKVEAAVRWVSAEPLLARTDFRPYLRGDQKLDWLVVGGESGRPGHDCRPCAIEWVDQIKDHCLDAKVPVFVKQLGSWSVSEMRMADTVEEANEYRRAAGHAERDDRWLWTAGTRDQKGEDPSEWPDHMRVRLFPGDPLPEASGFRAPNPLSEELA